MIDEDGNDGSGGSVCAYIILFCIIIKSFVRIENKNTAIGININITFILLLRLTNAFYYFLLLDKEFF